MRIRKTIEIKCFGCGIDFNKSECIDRSDIKKNPNHKFFHNHDCSVRYREKILKEFSKTLLQKDCTVCKLKKDISYFYKRKNSFTSYCKECYNEYARSFHHEYKE